MAQCKGSLIMLAVQSLRAAKLLNVPVELERYLTERVEILKWYPESDLLALLKTLARFHPKGIDSGLVEMGRSSALYHIEKTYRRQFDRGGDGALEQLWRSQHDTGTLKDYRKGDARVIELYDYDASTPEMCLSLTGYTEEVLRHLGYKKSFKKLKCVHQGAACCQWSAL